MSGSNHAMGTVMEASRMLRSAAGALIGFLLSATLVSAEELVVLDSRDRVTQPILFTKTDQPGASVILFPGGGGWLDISPNGEILGNKSNFLVRSRDLFAAHNLNVAVFEAPSDHQDGWGMRGGFRTTKEHTGDIAAVVAYLKSQAAVPVWLIGTSRGTESAAYGAIRLADTVTGLVLTASVTEPNDKGAAMTEMDLGQIQMPVMIVSHRDDECWVTSPEGTAAIRAALSNAPEIRVLMVDGGDEPISDACRALSAHGFLGIEKTVVDEIVSFINNQSN